jgi:predicted DNA-binding ribbon-helix-helix protein
MKKHSVTLRGHRTSISLEEIFWKELQRMAEAQRRPLQKLIEEIDRGRAGSLSSALRVYVMREAMRGK